MTVTLQHLRFIFFALIASGGAAFSTASFGEYEVLAHSGGAFVAGTTTPGDVSYTYVGAGPVGTSAVANYGFTASPVASVNYSATVSNPPGVPNPLGQVVLVGGGQIVYSFEVTAQPFTSVPIDFSGLFSSYHGGDPTLTSVASFFIQSNNNFAQFASSFAGDCGLQSCVAYTTLNSTYVSTQSDASHLSGSFQGSFNMLTGAAGIATGTVKLQAGASIRVYSGTASASSFIDPHLEIDAAFLALHPGASLSIFQGVGNEIAAVPEPSPYALMLGGLAIFGIVARKVKKLPADAW